MPSKFLRVAREIRGNYKKDYFQNGKAETSENPLLHPSKENTETTVKINVCRMLDINQKLAIIWRDFTEGKQLNLSNSSKQLCGILTCHIAIFSFPNHSHENQQTHNQGSCEMPIQKRQNLGISQKPHSQRIITIWFVWKLPGIPIHRACLYVTWPKDSRLTGKDPDAGKDWRQKEKWAAEDERVWLNGHEHEQTLGESEG